MASGFYREVELMKPQQKDNKIKDKYNEIEGTKKVESDDMMFYYFRTPCRSRFIRLYFRGSQKTPLELKFLTL
jgi:hypothetical protein